MEIDMEQAEKIEISAVVSAPIAQVWKTYTSPEDIVVWNTASDDWQTTTAKADLRVGGEFSSRMEAKDGSMGFDFAGTYTKVIANQLLEYSFGDRAAQVEFIQETSGVRVKVTFEAESSNPIEMQRSGWQAILDSFKRYTEAKARG
jgi:uncharacterized protein YndB with AHSA1/START domain